MTTRPDVYLYIKYTVYKKLKISIFDIRVSVKRFVNSSSDRSCTSETVKAWSFSVRKNIVVFFETVDRL
jgi:hypothetical protein